MFTAFTATETVLLILFHKQCSNNRHFEHCLPNNDNRAIGILSIVCQIQDKVQKSKSKTNPRQSQKSKIQEFFAKKILFLKKI